jgi:UDP-glucuronate 4-epimerase
MSRVLVTGAAGFIGFHVARRLLTEGHEVTTVDNLNNYYDVRLKEARLDLLRASPAFSFVRGDLSDAPLVRQTVREAKPQFIVHLAAQAGVRYSLSHPHLYIDSNISGFLNILESCRELGVEHLVYASSSSVYGANQALPFSEADGVDHPVSLYAATKRANELMAHAYSHLWRFPTTGLRFFTVYGPWGRPDMAIHAFAEAIVEGRPIRLFNNGNMYRDFTYIDDIVDGILRVLFQPSTPDHDWADSPRPDTSAAPFRLFNIGHNRPVKIGRIVEILEAALGRTAIVEAADMQPGDVVATAANIDSIAAEAGFEPRTSLEDGLANFTAWFLEWRRLTGGDKEPVR